MACCCCVVLAGHCIGYISNFLTVRIPAFHPPLSNTCSEAGIVLRSLSLPASLPCSRSQSLAAGLRPAEQPGGVTTDVPCYSDGREHRSLASASEPDIENGLSSELEAAESPATPVTAERRRNSVSLPAVEVCVQA